MFFVLGLGFLDYALFGFLATLTFFFSLLICLLLETSFLALFKFLFTKIKEKIYSLSLVVCEANPH